MNVEPRALWTCPHCGRRFVTRNMWHSCEIHTVEEHLQSATPIIRDTYLAYEGAARACGDDVEVVAQRSRIVFMVRVRYAGAVIRKGAVEARIALRRTVDSPRIHRTETYDNGWVGHYVRLRSPADVDDEIRTWLCESYALGAQTG